MDARRTPKEANAVGAAGSDAMRYAIKCLSGKRIWNGKVRGLFGLVNRSFVIESDGIVASDGLTFVETLRFDDGETQTRRWRIFDTLAGLGLEADDVRLIRHGRVSNGILEIVYKVDLKAISAAYFDCFQALDDGAVANFGRVAILGVPIMKVDAHGSANKEG